MLLKQYISEQNLAASIKSFLYPLLISIYLSACSAIPEPELEKPHNEKTLAQQDAEAMATDEQSVKQAHLLPAKNLYLQQQIDKPIIIAEGVEKDYQQALTLMKEKKWQQAQALFEQVILKQPNLSGSYVNQAIIAKQQDKLIEAQLLLTKAIKVNSLNLYAHHLQGQVYRLQGAFDQSEQSYRSALAIWPDFAEAHMSMAILLELYRGRLLEAHASYRTYLMLKPADEEGKAWLAGLEIKIKRAGLEVPKIEQVRQTPVDNISSDEQLTVDKNLMGAKELNHDKS